MRRFPFWPFGGKGDLTCTEVRTQASELIDPNEDASASLVEKLQRHLAGCPPCAAFVRTLQATVELVRTMPHQHASDELKEKLRRLSGEETLSH